ncbi:MAG: hypothetical protein ACHP91_03110 [Burkholderiales bacterium]
MSAPATAVAAPAEAAPRAGAAIAVVSVATPSHLHRARCLFESVARHLPAADRRLALVARDTRACATGEPFAATPLAGFGLPEFEAFVSRYRASELCFAAKPWAIAEMFRRGYERVIYFDTDIVAYSTLAPIVGTLDRAAILLTPHRIEARERDTRSELVVLQAGVYNAGFVALRQSHAAGAFLHWWQRKLEHDCVVDVTRGLCGDQRFVDLVPAQFDDVAIVREPGWNVGAWNLDERALAVAADGYTANGRPLVFFHFSGHERAPPATPALRALAADYVGDLARCGQARCATLPYDFAQPRDVPGLRALRFAGAHARRWLHKVTTTSLRRRVRLRLRPRP